MRHTIMVTAATAALALGSSALVAPATASPEAVSTATSSYIVVLDDSATARTVADRHAGRFGLDLGHVYSSALQGYSATMSAATAALVASLPGWPGSRRTPRSRRPRRPRPPASTGCRPT